MPYIATESCVTLVRMKLVVLLCGNQTNPDFRDVSGVISQITRIPGFLPNSGTTVTYGPGKNKTGIS